MQKSLFAAAIATGAQALKLEAPTSTLAQSKPAALECHGVYAYQCIEEKVEHAQDTLSGRVQATKDHCVDLASELRESILEGIQSMRYDLTKSLEDMRRMSTEDLNDALDASIAAIHSAAKAANANNRQEAADRLSGESAISVLRKRAQDDIKKLYYRDGNGVENSEELKAAIRAIMDTFAESIGSF